jgi:PAS domain S-box-containing protein
VATLNWVGWATGIQALTRIYPSWPQMVPWTALWLVALAVALLVQSGRPTHARVWVGRSVAAAVGVLATVVLAEYATGRALGVDQVWFGTAVRGLQSTWPGRPSPQTAISVLFLSVAVGVTRVDRGWARLTWVLCCVAAMVAPAVTALAYLFHAVSLLTVAQSTGMALATALALLLLGFAAVTAHPERGAVGRLRSRPDRRTLIRLVAIIASFPIFVGLSRMLFLSIGLSADSALTFSTAVGTGVVGLLAFHLNQRDERQRAAAESDRILLRASADSMLDPQVLLEADRDVTRQVVDFRYRSVNQAACSYLGLRESDLVGHTQREATPNLESPELQRRYIQCLDDGEPVIHDDFALFNETLDDARRYDIRATRAGADLLSLTWRDVTERFVAAQRLAVSEENYRLLAENSGDVIVHLRDTKIVWVSPSVQAVLGAPPEHWVGRQMQEAVLPEATLDLAAQAATVLAGGEVRRRIRILAADGLTHWFHMHAKPFYDASGREDGALSTLRLIDDEVAAEQEAEEARRQQARAEARYRRSMDSAAIGMCLVAPNGAFVEVNDALCELFGYDADTLKQKTWQELTVQEYLQADLDNFNDVLEGRKDSYRMLKQYVHADGHRIWGDLSVSCIRDENGQVDNLVSQIADITAEVAAREQLAQSDEQNRLLAQRLQQQSEQIAAELESAAAYMASIMPSGLTGAVDVTSRYLPSRELGGDCFDYTWIDDDHLLVYLIDVSGHGLEPALLAVSVHNMLRSGTLGIESMVAPQAALTELNRLFQMDDQVDHYFTIWYSVYQASTRTLRYASAGAPPAIAFDNAGDGTVSLTELFTPAIPVGMFGDTVFTTRTYAVPPGCRILIYSDGAQEILLADEHQLSAAGFKEINARLAGSSSWSLDGLLKELMDLTPTKTFDDDCSLIQLTFP